MKKSALRVFFRETFVLYYRRNSEEMYNFLKIGPLSQLGFIGIPKLWFFEPALFI